MTTPTLPDYNPARPSREIYDYNQRVEAYGPPPVGYQWLRVGEKIPPNSFILSNASKRWCRAAPNFRVASENSPVCCPCESATIIPADPSAAVALEVVGRNSKAVRFKIARQSPAVKFRFEFTASNGMLVASLYYPEVLFSTFYPKGKLYLRGTHSSKDHSVLSCTPAQFKRTVAALAEYNASLTPKAETKIVPSPTVAELQSEIAALEKENKSLRETLAKINKLSA